MSTWVCVCAYVQVKEKENERKRERERNRACTPGKRIIIRVAIEGKKRKIPLLSSSAALFEPLFSSCSPDKYMDPSLLPLPPNMQIGMKGFFTLSIYSYSGQGSQSSHDIASCSTSLFSFNSPVEGKYWTVQEISEIRGTKIFIGFSAGEEELARFKI